jgi:hypothetical protein
MRRGSYLIVNNYTLWADMLSKLSDITLVGAILPEYYSDEAGFIDSADLPRNATSSQFCTYYFKEGQLIDHPDPDALVFEDESPNNPDGLFIFRFDDEAV